MIKIQYSRNKLYVKILIIFVILLSYTVFAESDLNYSKDIVTRFRDDVNSKNISVIKSWFTESGIKLNEHILYDINIELVDTQNPIVEEDYISVIYTVFDKNINEFRNVAAFFRKEVGKWYLYAFFID